MARSKTPPPPGDDIPAWFMTYSDVITLLMTFFILLLTFSTTEPERFEKSISTLFSNGSATGTAGEKMKAIDRDSFVNRLRVPASRIALRGAEMPPITREPASETWGKGLKSLTEEEKKQNELTSHSFDVPMALVFDSNGKLTPQGKKLSTMLADQLRSMPFRASLSYSDQKRVGQVAAMCHHLFHVEMTRPGQVAMTYVDQVTLNKQMLRVSVERFSKNEQKLFTSGLESN